MFDKLLWAAGGAVVMYLALKQRARIETIVRDAIDRGETKPATTSSDDGPDAELPGGCSGGCGCGGTCGGAVEPAPTEAKQYPTEPKVACLVAPCPGDPWVPIDLGFSF